MDAARQRFKTSTVLPGNGLVPWRLATSGPLAYRVEQPPSRDYYFQYGWVLPGVLSPSINPRRHYYFGAQYKEDARELFAFWNAARSRHVELVLLSEGSIERDRVRAPLGAYRWEGRDGARLMLVQHGSYQCVDECDQPLLAAGVVRLYRGIHKSKVFRPCPMLEDSSALERARVWEIYLGVQAKVLSDSVLSFNSAHDRVRRCETAHIHDGSWLTDCLAREAGLPIDGTASSLWRRAHESYSLVRWVAENKFGPSYIVSEMAADNVRLTTFFAGENEVRVVDPRLVKIVDARGCRVENCDARGVESNSEAHAPSPMFGERPCFLYTS